MCLIKSEGGVGKRQVFLRRTLNCVTEKQNWNTQLMSMIFSYDFLAAETESGIYFSSTRLDFDAHEDTIFRK